MNRTTIIRMKATLAFILTFAFAGLSAKSYTVTSPNKQLKVVVKDGDNLSYSLYDGKIAIMTDNKLGMTVASKGDLCSNPKVIATESSRKKETITAPFYRQASYSTSYNQLSITLKSGITVEFRVFDEGAAYRYSIKGLGEKYFIENENAEFNFTEDHKAYLPHSTNKEKPFYMGFQATYAEDNLSIQQSKPISFLPVTVDAGNAKITIMESDLESYPGMFVDASNSKLKGVFAQYPKTWYTTKWRAQRHVETRENFIAVCAGDRSFPWRIISVSHDDCEMPVNNLVYTLSSENRIGDTSWIKPGKVAWDWWNDWGISGVDFKAGINQNTYKHFIDFASKYGIEYIVLDEGWYVPSSGDMLTVIPELDLPELVRYAKSKNVDVVLWTVFNVLDDQLEEACKRYSQMGIKGFKVDFLDRDDQEATDMAYRIARKCADYKLMLDYHGIYKPTGMNRAYPNIINFESVFGMEEVKWTKHGEQDMPKYDVTFPFIRMQCGYVDFTPGGMRNATEADFQPIYSNPLTMGTRCHQLAMYIVHDSPFTMLADNPTAYEREPEYTKFIVSLPTVFDKTIIPMGKMGEYIVTARQKGNDWYVAGQTNWNERDLTIDFSFLPAGRTFKATIYTDGINANKVATDYVSSSETIMSSTQKTIHLAKGGGFAISLKAID